MTDHLATILISGLKLFDKTMPFKRIFYNRSKSSEKQLETALTSISWESFYRQNNPEKTFNVFNFNVVIYLKRFAPLETVYIRNDKFKVNLKDDRFISKFLNPKTAEQKKSAKISKKNHTT